MPRSVLCLFVIALLIPHVPLRAAESGDLHPVIEKAVQAAGGLENLERAHRHRGREEGTHYGRSEGSPFTATFAYDPPQRFRLEIQGVFTMVVDGNRGWVRTGETTHEIPPQQLREQLEEQFIGWVVSLVPLVKHKDHFELSSIPGERVDGRETIGIEVASKGRRNVKLFFDKSTYDLLKAAYTVRAAEQDFAEIGQELIIKKYATVAGAKLPSQIVILRNGQKYVEARITQIEPVEKFSEAVFAKP